MRSFFDVVIPDWTIGALCAQTDPEAFYPEKGGSTRAAKKVCAVCPVQRQCLEQALANGESFGVWAGFTGKQLRKVRREREAA